MAQTLQPVPPPQNREYQKWLLSMPIGLRLFFAFQVIILFTGLIGLLAGQRFSLLTTTATELNTHYLPEAILLGDLRMSLLQQRDMERSLVINRLASPQKEATMTTLTETLQQISNQQAKLLALEATSRQSYNDTSLIPQLSRHLADNKALSQQIHVLIQNNQFAQARLIEQQQHEPLLQSTLNTVGVLLGLVQQETNTIAAQVQQGSQLALLLIISLTALALGISVLFATIFTRSLTEPLSALVAATKAMAAGNLDVSLSMGRRDEIGQLASAFDTMRQSLRSTISTLAVERQQTQAILDSSLDGVLLLDEQRTILQCNPAARRFSGSQSDDLQGKPCWEVFGCRGTAPEEAETHEQLCPLKAVLQTPATSASTEMPIASRPGQQRWFAISCASMPSHAGTAGQRLVMNLHDITQLKAVEQAKSDFVAMVSHELRAPLTTVMGSVEMLSLLDPANDREALDEVVQLLDQQTQRLRQVIEKVLQLTRLEAGRLQIRLQPLPLLAFLYTLVEQIRQEHPEDERTLSVERVPEEIEVWADPDALEIVIRNLLSNAYKYTPVGSPITIAVETPDATGRVHVRVSDHGPGIPPGQLTQIFERFARKTPLSAGWTGGYGLGLSITRELLRLHNGEIWAEPCQQGARFVLFLRAVHEEQHRPNEEKEGSADANHHSDD